MPVTAKLSRQFYEKLGDDVANELVEWFNQVDATYRSELRDLAEGYFLRFDAKLEQRLAEVRARLEQCATKAELETLGTRFILWSFGFWIAAVGTILGVLKLAGVF